jgi:hypothetical protein
MPITAEQFIEALRTVDVAEIIEIVNKRCPGQHWENQERGELFSKAQKLAIALIHDGIRV